MTLWLLAMLAACGETSDAAPTLGTTSADATAAADGSLGDATGGTDAASGDSTSADDAGDVSNADGSIPTADATADVGDAADAVSVGDAVSPGDAVSGGDVNYKYTICSTLLLCVQVSCSQGAAGCLDVCTQAASPAAAAPLQPFLTCMDTYCTKGVCQGSSDPACALKCAGDKCWTKTLACGADGASGTATCDTMLGCLGGCKDNVSCMYGCWGKMSSSAQADFDAFMSCALASGAKDPFAACPEQGLKCLAGGKTGSATCPDLVKCWEACELKPEAEKGVCVGQCFGQATSEAQKAWLALLKCEGGDQGACKSALLQCSQPIGKKICLQTLQCIEGCEKANVGMSCVLGCLHDASPAEATATLEFGLCVESQCKACGGDNACEDKCASEKCAGQKKACLGS